MERLINGLAALFSPKAPHLVQVDSWFDSRWLRFSGKRLGVVGVRNTKVTVPPFHPNRVLQERRLVREAGAPAYTEAPDAPALHLRISSGANITRHLHRLAPDVACVWYTSQSAPTNRGATMIYVPQADTEGAYWTCYMAFAAAPWRVTRHKGISTSEIAQLEAYGDRQAPA